MKETNFSEKESLELIAQMIQQTKDNMKVGNGNVLLYYGYPAILIALVVYLLVLKTGNSLWATGWFLMFVPGILLKLKNSRHKPSVITYMDKAVDNTWTVVGSLFALSVVAILLTGVWIGVINFGLMLPLSLLCRDWHFYYGSNHKISMADLFSDTGFRAGDLHACRTGD